MSDSINPNLTILIPAYNEEAVIEGTVRTISEFFRRKEVAFEVLVVDNNSQDRTAEILTRLTHEITELRWIKSPPFPGYGVAVRAGLDEYSGDIVVIVMADGSETPEDIFMLYDLVNKGADCGFGTRFSGEDRTNGYPFFKRYANRAGNHLLSLLVGDEYDDFTNGFKAYRRSVIDRIQPLKGDEFELTVEMAMKAFLSGANIEVATNSWKDREGGESKFKLVRQSARYMRVVCEILATGQSNAATMVRFLGVGFVSSMVYLAVLSLMVELAEVSVTVGVAFSYVIGTVVSYLGSALFAFQKSLTGTSAFRFLIVVGISFLLNISIAYALDMANVHYFIVGLIIIATVSMFNFFSHRYWTFQKGAK